MSPFPVLKQCFPFLGLTALRIWDSPSRSVSSFWWHHAIQPRVFGIPVTVRYLKIPAKQNWHGELAFFLRIHISTHCEDVFHGTFHESNQNEFFCDITCVAGAGCAFHLPPKLSSSPALAEFEPVFAKWPANLKQTSRHSAIFTNPNGKIMEISWIRMHTHVHDEMGGRLSPFLLICFPTTPNLCFTLLDSPMCCLKRISYFSSQNMAMTDCWWVEFGSVDNEYLRDAALRYFKHRLFLPDEYLNTHRFPII